MGCVALELTLIGLAWLISVSTRSRGQHFPSLKWALELDTQPPGSRNTAEVVRVGPVLAPYPQLPSAGHDVHRSEGFVLLV